MESNRSPAFIRSGLGGAGRQRDLAVAVGTPPGERSPRPASRRRKWPHRHTNQRETTVVWDRATGEPVARPSSGSAAYGRFLQFVAASSDGAAVTQKRPAWWWMRTSRRARSAGFSKTSRRTIARLNVRQHRRLAHLEVGPAQIARDRSVQRLAPMLMNLASGDWDPETDGAVRSARTSCRIIVPSSSVVGTTTAESRGLRYPSPASRATSRRRWRARPVFARAVKKTLMAPDCFALCTQAFTGRCRRTGCSRLARLRTPPTLSSPVEGRSLSWSRVQWLARRTA